MFDYLGSFLFISVKLNMQASHKPAITLGHFSKRNENLRLLKAVLTDAQSSLSVTAPGWGWGLFQHHTHFSESLDPNGEESKSILTVSAWFTVRPPG